MSDMDVEKIREAEIAASKLALAEYTYQNIDKKRNEDKNREQLGMKRTQQYLEEDVKIWKENMMTQKDFQAAMNKENAWNKTPERIDLTRERILSGKQIATTAEEKHYDSKVNAAAQGALKNAAYERQFAIMDAAATDTDGTEEKRLLLREKYRDALIQTKEWGEAHMRILRSINIESKKLYLEEWLEWKRLAMNKLQFDQALTKTKLESSLSHLEHEESLGKRDPTAKIALRKQIGLNTIETAEKAAKIKIAELERQLDPKYNPKILNDDQKQTDLREQIRETKLTLANTKKDTIAKTDDQLESEKIAKNREDAEVAASTTKLKGAKLEYREGILEKQRSKAVDPDKVDSLGRQQADNLKEQLQVQLDLLAKNKEIADIGKTEAQKEVSKQQLLLDQLELKEKYLQKMEDITAEIEKQKALLNVDKDKFTMGGIYNSYDEINKATSTEGDDLDKKWWARQGGSGDPSSARSAAALKLGIPGTSLTDLTNTLGSGVKTKLGEHRDFAQGPNFLHHVSSGFTHAPAPVPTDMVQNNISIHLKGDLIGKASEVGKLSRLTATDKKSAFNNNQPMGGLTQA
jgi:hypothetical protein